MVTECPLLWVKNPQSEPRPSKTETVSSTTTPAKHKNTLWYDCFLANTTDPQSTCAPVYQPVGSRHTSKQEFSPSRDFTMIVTTSWTPNWENSTSHIVSSCPAIRDCAGKLLGRQPKNPRLESRESDSSWLKPNQAWAKSKTSLQKGRNSTRQTSPENWWQQL